jgi:hypothetical protein
LAHRSSAAVDVTLDMAPQDAPIEVVRALEVPPWLLRHSPIEGGQ